ncbi:MAG: hypothetical protein CMO55_24935 [Verrucomicrobiales bacterium]|nr:hypothetical protein [Verrucomicrobiales bacterium]
MNQTEENSEQNTYSHIEVVPSEPQPEMQMEPTAYRMGESLYLQEGAGLPTERCICCGKKSVKTVSKALRTPLKPMTWFGKTKTVEFGVCKEHKESNAMGSALTYSALIVGILILVVGAVSLSFATIFVGMLAVAVSGVFRARMPVYTADPSVEPVEIKGHSLSYLDLVPEAVYTEE